MIAQLKSVFAPRLLISRLAAATISTVFILSPIARAEDDLLAPSGTSEMSNEAAMPTQDPNMPPAHDASVPPADHSGMNASEEPAPARPAKKSKKHVKKKKAGKKAKKSAKKTAKKKKKKHNYS